MNELIARVKGMILAPAQEWRAIAREPVELLPLFTRYVMILAAIPAIAGFLAGLFWSPFYAFTGAFISYVLSLVSVFVTAKIIEVLAPSFGGPQDADAALKLAAFAPTAFWVASAAKLIGIVAFVPILGPLLAFLGGLVAFIGGLYTLYTLFLGVPIVMRVPQDKALVFTLAVIGVTIVVYLVAGLLTAIVL